ncbi:uncharacterized protein LOC6550182 [Drosophila erecta]|uniref:Uncharacterized protein n=1 Tax=Drosophila erecta TaxID=7220 RepID=B3NX76_DROER|nr:uncharacterized protein LOC6550182 [Drosophila erecta]EDV47248.1 uncharacterized protein Dere_GG17750 [Drosophila erecta]
MAVLKLNSFHTRFFPSARLRCKELARRWYLLQVRQQRQQRSEPTVPAISQSLQPISSRELLSKHVIGGFRLQVHRNSFTQRLEITATLANPTVPPDTDPAPEDEQLYELCICSSRGQLVRRMPFLESDYRRAARSAIDCLAI